MELTAKNFVKELRALQSDAEREKIRKFYKGSGDTDVIGVRMKDTFDTAARFTDMPLEEVSVLLDSPYYEARMGAMSILDFKARKKKITDDERRALYELYLQRHDRIDNWDLVDRAAPRVIGWYLLDKSREPLYKLARSSDIWERRTAITATFWLIRQGDIDDALSISEMLLDDDEDLIHKSVGTALREVGKIDEARLIDFLREHKDDMPRVTLRYATEKLPAKTRAEFVKSR